ncbi:hypothetical protein [Caballeronia terrestris]|uniref:hypothetical protein n=1 Tax=Caballeronia terrestris TaxID=1226301 RepID=UPI000A48F623|nr:hypothetical protein [Caballeronia terrestris]
MKKPVKLERCFFVSTYAVGGLTGKLAAKESPPEGNKAGIKSKTIAKCAPVMLGRNALLL